MGKAFSRTTPRLIRTMILVLLRSYFVSHREYPWSSKENMTKITIQSSYAEDANYQAVNPSIIVDGSGAAFSPSGIGSNTYHIEPHRLYLNKTTFQHTVNGGLRVYCFASSKDASEELGFEIATFMTGIKHYVAEMTLLQNISPPQVSPTQLSDRKEWEGKYLTIVSFDYTFTLQTIVTPVDPGPLLTAIETELGPTYTGVAQLPKPGDLDGDGKEINTSETGGTNTGGISGNWGGVGGLSPDYVADNIDDGIVKVKMRVSLNDK